MITSFRPSPSRKAQAWLDELPQAAYAEASSVERVINIDNPVHTMTRQVAAEILVQTGGRALYGLLGAELFSQETNELQLKVTTSRFDGPPYVSSIALPSEEVRIGLPDEYASSVVDAVLATAVSSAGLPPGKIIFNCAAHGLIGSSQQIFRALGQIIIRLFILDSSHEVKQQLTEIFKIQL